MLLEDEMSRAPRYKRTSFFVDPAAIRRARKALGAKTDADTVRLSVERVAEMDEFWRFMARTRGQVKPGTFEEP
jgi:hypothetical protein